MSIRMRHTKGHTGNRRSHHALKSINIVQDKKSGNFRLPHHLDEITGMYRDRQLFVPKVKRAVKSKLKGPDTEPSKEQKREHARTEHANADAKSSKGFLGKVIGATSRPKARSGFGGGV